MAARALVAGVAFVTGGFCGGVAGFEPGVVVGCVVVGCVGVVEGFGVLPSVPVVPFELDGVEVGAGVWPGSGSGLLSTLATNS